MHSPFEPHHELEKGDVVDKYVVDGVIGSGGMGFVVAARHRDLGHRVALKFMNPDVACKPVAVQRFLREARAAARLTSEHVCRVFDVGELPSGVPYMAMEYLEGSTLADEQGAMTSVAVAEIALQACDALGEAHALGVIHRDLKPANLFLATRARERRILKLLDFGISKVDNAEISIGEDLTRTAIAIGTPNYMAPEQLLSSKTVDARADIWSLGVCLFKALTNRLPYDADTLPALGYLLATKEPPSARSFRPDVPEALSWIVSRCLRRNADERYANVADIASDLVAFLNDLSSRPTHPPAAPSWSSRGGSEPDLAFQRTGVHHVAPPPRSSLALVSATSASVTLALVLTLVALFGSPQPIGRVPAETAAPPSSSADAGLPGAPRAAAPEPPDTGVPTAPSPPPLPPSRLPPSRPRAGSRAKTAPAVAGDAVPHQRMIPHVRF
jgi:serine/threonine-protein kinase